MKGVILAGGTGSRLHPLTRITNKHLLPIFDRPMVTYAIEALVRAGVTEMMVVTGGTHAGEFLRLLGNGHEWGIDRLLYAYQEQPGGIAEALGLAQRFVEDDQVVVVLGDNIFEFTIRAAVERFRKQPKGGRILLAEIKDPQHLRHLGVPAFDGDHRIVKVVEKPSTPPSAFAVTGIYLYPASVFDILPRLKPSGRGELEITDVNNSLIEGGLMEWEVLQGFWGDAGESIDAYYAVNDFVRKHGANKPIENLPAELSGKNPPPQLSGKNSPPQLSRKNPPPQLSGKNPPPQLSGKNPPPQLSRKNSPPPLAGEGREGVP